MGMVPCLSDLINLALSQKYSFSIFRTYRSTVLKSVIQNQFGCTAKEALFLATNQALGAESEDARVERIKAFHLFLWTDLQIKPSTLRKLFEIGQIIENLAGIYVKDIASELWAKSIDTKPPDSFDHSKSRMKNAMYRYWILCQLYHDFTPQRRLFFESNLDKKTFQEFYRPLSVRDWLDMGFFEECFFPRFMKKICGECNTRGVCYSQYQP